MVVTLKILIYVMAEIVKNRTDRSFDAYGVCGCGSVMSARKRPATTLALHTTRGGIRCPLRGGSRCGPVRGWCRWWGRSRGSAA